MDATIRNLDEALYRELKAQAVRTGKTIGELVNEAIRRYLERPGLPPKRGSLRDLTPEAYPEGNERLSEQIDAVVYGRIPGHLRSGLPAGERDHPGIRLN